MHAWSLGQKENNNMLPLRRHNFFSPILVPQHFFFLFLPKFRESPREFPEIFGNSQNFSGIPRNSREFSYFFPLQKCEIGTSGKISIAWSLKKYMYELYFKRFFSYPPPITALG